MSSQKQLNDETASILNVNRRKSNVLKIHKNDIWFLSQSESVSDILVNENNKNYLQNEKSQRPRTHIVELHSLYAKSISIL